MLAVDVEVGPGDRVGVRHAPRLHLPRRATEAPRVEGAAGAADELSIMSPEPWRLLRLGYFRVRITADAIGPDPLGETLT